MQTRLLFLPFLLLLLGLSSCLEDRCEDEITYQVYEPVTVLENEWRTENFDFETPHDICSPSGFYVYGDLLFVVDRNAGVHIINNEDSSNPQPLTFLKAVGGQGIAIRNNILYLSQFTDVVTFDLSSPRRPVFLNRVRDAFNANEVFARVNGDGSAVLEYVPTLETVTQPCDGIGNGADYYYGDHRLYLSSFANVDLALADVGSTRNNTAGELVGVGGSLARFTINNGTLYAVDNRSLRTFSLADPAAPVSTDVVELGWDIETIFPYEDFLYIGSMTGMHIVDVSSPLAPVHRSTFTHMTSCDPVVVRNNIAYVTMWGGSDCNSITDRLEVVDVSNPDNPTLLQSFDRQNSHGLAVTADKLFLASGEAGMEVFKLAEDGRVGETLGRVRDFNAWDVIALPANRQLIVFGQDKAGIQQYDYTEEGTLLPTSHLEICQ